MSEWLDNSNNANCFKSMYVNGFVDVSGIIISREPTLGLVLSGDASFNAGLSVSGNANVGDFLHIAANSTEWATPGKGLFMRYSLTGTHDGGYIQSIDRTSGNLYPLSFDASKYAFNQGNVGIGVSAPDAKLHIHGGTLGRTAGDESVIANFYNINPHENKLKIISRRNTTLPDPIPPGDPTWSTASTVIRNYTDTTGQGFIEFNPLGNAYGIGIGNNLGMALTMASDKNIGIGTTNPTYTLDVSGTIRSTEVKIGTSTISTYDGNTNGLDLDCAGGDFSVNVGTVNVIFIPAAGHTYIGVATQDTYIKSQNGGVYLSGYTATGDVITAGDYGRLTISSDIRLKKNIVEYNEPSMEKIMKLKPSYYEWISEKSSGQTELGFIAQDVETVIPEAVDGKKYEYEWKRDESGEPILDANGDLQFSDVPRYRGFKTRPVVCVMVKAMQEQQAHIQAQADTIQSQADTIQAILGRLDNAGI